ncbi:MAG: phenylalanine--tRNA ligase subunit alpha, partial [Acidimicrobiales bacterium]|nr:phenylalanine--tRNA ligase subunit alpha [Acidimicrobiales bacterium]
MSMIEQLAAIGDDAESRAAEVATLAELDSLGSELLGKRSRLGELKKGLRDLDEDERRAAGRALNDANARVQAALDARRADLEAQERRRRLDDERLDLTETIATRALGHLHLVTQTHDRLEDVFVGMGFTVAEG